VEPTKLVEASDLLFDLWMQGQRIAELPPALRPATRAEGYKIQSLLELRSARKLFGWKIAATSGAGQRHIGVDGPLAGRLLAERVIENHGVCPLAGNFMRVAELEFAFRMSEDIAPRPQGYSLQEVMARVATLHPAIEIPDSRFERYEMVGAPQLIADDACADRFLLGPASPEAWRSLNLATQEVRGAINDVPWGPGIGRNVLGDPCIALTWLINELSQQGVILRAGEVVTTGTCLPPGPITSGDRVRGNFGMLGEVSMTLA